jgi:hypothetical protein
MYAHSECYIELAYQLRDSEAKVVIAHTDTVSLALATARKVGLPATSVYLFTNPGESLERTHEALRPWTEIWASPEDAQRWSWHRITTIEEAQGTAAIINYSSG